MKLRMICPTLVVGCSLVFLTGCGDEETKLTAPEGSENIQPSQDDLPMPPPLPENPKPHPK